MRDCKRVFILGSTGSIGRNTLKVIEQFPDRFKVVGLVAGRNREALQLQTEKFGPERSVLVAEEGLEAVKRALEEVEFDVAVCAITGSAGILPTYWAALKGARLALANKESLVCAGRFITEAAREIIPVDSEHSAIFQCLVGEKQREVEEIILTASGGPFREREDLESVTPQEALKHPNWKMGPKVTVDSATLMNKGLEVIEAFWLFKLSPERIKVVVHPQSVVHSLVRFTDQSVKAQLGVPDMRVPIAYALSFPERLPLGEELKLNLVGQKLEFYEPDTERFPCLKLAYRALEEGYPYPIILNAADEVAVELFLEGKIAFTKIPRLIEKTLESSNFKEPASVEEVVQIDKRARELARQVAKWL
ncbi:1-deoxy-D-xylulose 5-phosphate reductoisomerase [Thermovibrio ammonificans HB-1]|uniref:1-deoxy-D-xylulose 5-phosphate reductoisomerase n=1 Tax=Thermovibrio ammonificans (strain DSM 15698 / JCM 12110 / HB-1) TaxID=648996 RepID=E8T5R6_THEA1|nr:1-deoxy-D-xylulose-5-phosphate reductoisomerase [Thermovibrio ammonificans]ADU96541.1 1-deoxy-D-xylulose 5-phosphate reductoisomerase [Thermovibrio ammonificans HB-1]